MKKFPPPLPPAFRNRSSQLRRLEVAFAAPPEWDAEHRALTFRHRSTRLRPRRLYEVEIYQPRSGSGLRICLNFVAEITAVGASFQAECPVRLSRSRLALACTLARRSGRNVHTVAPNFAVAGAGRFSSQAQTGRWTTA